jgi:hypothetical protein
MLYDEIKSIYEENKGNPTLCIDLMERKAYEYLQKQAEESSKNGKYAYENLKAVAQQGNNAINIFAQKMGTPKDTYKKAIAEAFPDFGESLFK